MSVREETIKDYMRGVAEFYDFLSESERVLDDTNEVETDVLLTVFANHLFKQGVGAGEGDKLRAAFAAFHPAFARGGGRGLPRLRRALRGWTQIAPSTPTTAMPEAVLDAISDVLMGEGKFEVALWLQTAFSCMLRPISRKPFSNQTNLHV